MEELCLKMWTEMGKLMANYLKLGRALTDKEWSDFVNWCQARDDQYGKKEDILPNASEIWTKMCLAGIDMMAEIQKKYGNEKEAE